MKSKSKIIDITGISITQMENGLNVYLNNNWKLVSVFTMSSKTYAVLIREIAE